MVVTTEAPDSVTVCTMYTVVGEARMNVVVATAWAAGSLGEQTPTPDSLVPERQMPLLPEPELETPLLLQPVLPVPELGRQDDCGSRGRRRGEGLRGEVLAARAASGCGDGPSGEAHVAGSSSSRDSRAFLEVVNNMVSVQEQ